MGGGERVRETPPPFVVPRLSSRRGIGKAVQVQSMKGVFRFLENVTRQRRSFCGKYRFLSWHNSA